MRKEALSLASTALVILLAAVSAVSAVTVCVGTRPAEAAFPGINGKIAFMSSRDGDFKIYTMKPDGSGVQQPFRAPGKYEAYPAWSPSGRKLAFVGSGHQCLCRGNEIYKANADGTNVERLTDNRRIDTLPTWSPNGGKIAFVSRGSGGMGYSLFTMLADGSHLTELVSSSADVRVGATSETDPASGYNPSWSPDGKKIAFVGWRSDSSGNNFSDAIYTVNRDGSGLQLLIDNAAGPDWSPDGQQIAYTAGTYDSGLPLHVKVQSLDANKQLIGTPIDLGLGAEPAWSPDGKKIVYENGATLLKSAADRSSVPTPIYNAGNGSDHFGSPKVVHSSTWQPRH